MGDRLAFPTLLKQEVGHELTGWSKRPNTLILLGPSSLEEAATLPYELSHVGNCAAGESLTLMKDTLLGAEGISAYEA